MKTENMFESLVEYHINHNLEECIDRISNGKIMGENGRNLIEGKDSNVPYHGVLIVANGDTLAERLIRDKIVHDTSVEFKEINTKKNLYDLLNETQDDDGSFIFDGKNSQIANVQEVNNDVPNLSPEYSVYDSIPDDFFIYGADSNKDQRMGTKTRLAAKIPYAYSNTESFQIKRSSYTDFGMGKVTHFNKDGLVEEFFLKYEHEKIIGIYRKYNRDEEGKILKIEEIKYCIRTLEPKHIQKKVA